MSEELTGFDFEVSEEQNQDQDQAAVPNERDEPEQSIQPSLSSNELEARAEEFARQQDIQIGEHFQIEEAPGKDFVRFIDIPPEAGQPRRVYTHDLDTLEEPHSDLRVHINEVDRRFNLAVENFNKQLSPYDSNEQFTKEAVSQWINSYSFLWTVRTLGGISTVYDIKRSVKTFNPQAVYDKLKADVIDDMDIEDVMASFIMQQRDFWLKLKAGAAKDIDGPNFERIAKMIDLLRAYKYDLPFADDVLQAVTTNRGDDGRLDVVKMPAAQILGIKTDPSKIYQLGLKVRSLFLASLPPAIPPRGQPYQHNIHEMIAAGQDKKIDDVWFMPNMDHQGKYQREVHKFINQGFIAPVLQTIFTMLRDVGTTRNFAKGAATLAYGQRDLIHNIWGSVSQWFASDEIEKQRESKARLHARARELSAIVGLKSYGIIDGESLQAFRGFEEDNIYDIRDHVAVQMCVYVLELFTGGDKVRAAANMQQIVTKAQLVFSKLDDKTKELICAGTYSQDAQIRGEGCRIIEGRTKKRKQPEPAKSEL